MKANRKFLEERDDAVSPVIAVILMVAITVVLAATVYVWVSGFGAQSSSPAKSIALSSSGAIAKAAGDPVWFKNYTLASASPGLKYDGLEVHVNGVKYTQHTTGDCTTSSSATTPLPDAHWMACAGATKRTGDSVTTAGDQLTIRSDADLSGATLRFIDPNSNSVVLTLTMS